MLILGRTVQFTLQSTKNDLLERLPLFHSEDLGLLVHWLRDLNSGFHFYNDTGTRVSVNPYSSMMGRREGVGPNGAVAKIRKSLVVAPRV